MNGTLQVYDMVFMDLEMSAMDGLGCVRALREWEAQLLEMRILRQPICILSSHTGADNVLRCSETSVDFFEGKPVMALTIFLFY
jgi:CheY-like chemotaxis protein